MAWIIIKWALILTGLTVIAWSVVEAIIEIAL